MNKVLCQKVNLTLEDILKISPRFMEEMKFLSETERKYLMSLKCSNTEEQELPQEKIIVIDKIHFFYPPGMMEVYIGQKEYTVKALVDTGAELNIIPENESIKAGLAMGNLDIKLRGIGGHSTAIVGLAENTPIILPSGDEGRIHFFVSRGAVHAVIGRPFLADNGIRFDHSQDQGEILSYKEPHGRRFCIPICSPETKGWHVHPPKGMELCNSTQIKEWGIIHIMNIRRFQELPQESSRTKNTQVSIKPNPEIPIKHFKAELTINDLKIRKVNNVHLNYPQTSENTYSSNMEASIPIEVELVQNEGLKPKQLVNSISPGCGKSGCHIIKEQKPVSVFYKPFSEAIFSKPKHSISPIEFLRVSSGAPIMFTQKLLNKFKNKKIKKKFNEDFPVENQKPKNEEISSDLSYINSSQEETHQMENHQSSPSLEDYISSGKTLSLIEDKLSPHKEQKIKMKGQLFSDLNYFIIQK
ncbi:hypothetical protein O181_059829 [Austropuccinia psidii MF-1]|uniref:Peptidase A2 domain-containing protein n=1 Tax=Austropuccinia psidii MF-1 TaxID=1389203 RepID=A0A9Q3EF43_9BASI|nr:hypothetical protein [Austropuccinia psidii MF-1]